VVDPLGRVKGVPANWNYIVMRSEVKTLGGKISLWPLSLSGGGSLAGTARSKGKMFSVMRFGSRESQLKCHSHRQVIDSQKPFCIWTNISDIFCERESATISEKYLNISEADRSPKHL